MDTIFYLDQHVFFAINHLPHPPLLDGLALFFSGIGTAGVVWFLLGLVLFIREKKKDHWFFLPLVSAGIASWVAVEALLKPLAARSRPGLELGAIVVGSSIGFSFPSGHATTAWAMAVILARKEPRWKVWLYGLAALISFSRIYLGVHYPLDVIAGAALGWTLGTTTHRLLDKR